jgi:hypothetical protein
LIISSVSLISDGEIATPLVSGKMLGSVPHPHCRACLTDATLGCNTIFVFFFLPKFPLLPFPWFRLVYLVRTRDYPVTKVSAIEPFGCVCVLEIDPILHWYEIQVCIDGSSHTLCVNRKIPTRNVDSTWRRRSNTAAPYKPSPQGRSHREASRRPYPGRRHNLSPSSGRWTATPWIWRNCGGRLI